MHSSRPAAPCERWMRRSETDSFDGTEGVVDHYARAVDLPPAVDRESWFHRLEDRLLTYQVFPPHLMDARVCSDDGRLREGTTIVQRVAIGPWTLEAGVRVIRVWRRHEADRDEAGFTYATLEGHPEQGISTFRIRRSSGEAPIQFLIDVRSRPGSWITKLARPLARRFQIRVTKAALDYFTSAEA